MSDFHANDDHESLQKYYENWLNENPRFAFSEYTYHSKCSNPECRRRVISKEHWYKISRQNYDPTSLVIRGLPDLLVSDDVNHLSFYIEFKGPNTRTIEPTALAYQYNLVKMGVKILYIYAWDKGFVLTSECIQGLKRVYYHPELFRSDSSVTDGARRERQHNFIKNNLKPDLTFHPATTNGDSRDPFIWFTDLLKDAIVEHPMLLMDNLDMYD